MKTSIKLSIFCSITFLLSFNYICTHDWVNHIQNSLSDEQVKRDVQAMHREGKTVAQVIETSLRGEHECILQKMKQEMQVPDEMWQETMQQVEAKKHALQEILYSKENIHDCSWFITDAELKEIADSEEHSLWKNMRIVAKNTLLDFGINPKNIAIYANDAWFLNYLQTLIDNEPSWFNRQKLRFVKSLRTWNYSLYPIWCTFEDEEKPKAEISFNMSSMAYFEPTEQHALFGHELTHLIEGHIQEQEAIAELEQRFLKVSAETWRDYFHIHELMADQLPALKGIAHADKCSEMMFSMGIHWPISTFCTQPLVDYLLPKLSTHPSTIYRSRALTNIVRYLEYEAQLNKTT